MRYGIGFDEDCKLEDGSYDYLKVAASAHYRCQCCDYKIPMHTSRLCSSKARRETNLTAPSGHISYHLNSMYSPAMTFADLIVNWLQVSTSMHGLRKFIQGNLAEPWKEDWVNQDENEANALEQDYERGDLKGDYRILAVDTQTDHFRFCTRI